MYSQSGPCVRAFTVPAQPLYSRAVGSPTTTGGETHAPACFALLVGRARDTCFWVYVHHLGGSHHHIEPWRGVLNSTRPFLYGISGRVCLSADRTSAERKYRSLLHSTAAPSDFPIPVYAHHVLRRHGRAPPGTSEGGGRSVLQAAGRVRVAEAGRRFAAELSVGEFSSQASCHSSRRCCRASNRALRPATGAGGRWCGVQPRGMR